MTNTFFSSTICPLLLTIIFILSCRAQSNSSDTNNDLRSLELASKKEELSQLIRTYADFGEFNGAVLVAEKGEVLFKKGLGLANMEWDIPNQTNTKFRIGSITKQFTAMLIVQLAAENKLDLQVPISTYLPDYPKANADRITIHQLLTHSSGIPNNYGPSEPRKNKPGMHIPDNYASKDLVKAFSNLPLEFVPGEKFSYCNAGYTLLGYLIETITKKSYAEVLQERIFDPLNMNDTGFEKYRPLLKNRAAGYFQSWGTYYNANYIDLSNVYASGAIYSTVEDLWRWDRALYSEKLLPKKYLDLVFTPHLPDPGYGGHYGYGWSIKEKPIGNSNDQVQSISHDGVIDGFCAIFTRIPSSQSTIILLSNIRRAPLNAMTKGIMGILYDQPYDFPKKSVAYSFMEAIDQDGLDQGIEFYQSIKNDDTYYLSENEMNIISYRLLQSDRAAAAATILKLGIEEFPEAFNLYDSLGEVLIGLGKKEESIKNYKKSVALNPANENGLKMLRELSVDRESLKEPN